MTTLPDIRDRVRTDLRDLDPSASRWSDAELDRHITRALADLSLAAPLEGTTTVATVAGSRELTTNVLPEFLELESVELPVDAFPRRYVPFSVWAETITLNLPSPPKGEQARLRYLARHTLDEQGSTLPEALDDVLANGAAARAAITYAAFAIDRLNAGEDVAGALPRLGRRASARLPRAPARARPPAPAAEPLAGYHRLRPDGRMARGGW